nr:hypothetical protein [Pseudomonas sp. NBRC 111130]
MELILSPVRMNERLILSVVGDVITVNGESFDFSPLLEGATLPREAILSDWFPGDANRVDGVLSLTIRLPHGPYAPEETRYPKPIIVEAAGPVSLPTFGEPPVVDGPPMNEVDEND